MESDRPASGYLFLNAFCMGVEVATLQGRCTDQRFSTLLAAYLVIFILCPYELAHDQGLHGYGRSIFLQFEHALLHCENVDGGCGARRLIIGSIGAQGAAGPRKLHIWRRQVSSHSICHQALASGWQTSHASLSRHTVYSPLSGCARFPAFIVTNRVKSLIGWNSHTKPSVRRRLR
jgi:hypothetical protein